jgi:hypothetical protein
VLFEASSAVTVKLKAVPAAGVAVAGLTEKWVAPLGLTRTGVDVPVRAGAPLTVMV